MHGMCGSPPTHKVADRCPRTIYDHCLATKAEIGTSARLTSEAKEQDTHAAIVAAKSEIAKWSKRIDGVKTQIASVQSTLISNADATIPTPSDVRVSLMLQRLAGLEPLDIAALYYPSPAEDQKCMELAAQQTGRLPVKRGDVVMWERLLDPDIVTNTIMQRAAEHDAAGARQLADLVRIPNTFASLASSAITLIEASLPTRQTRTIVVRIVLPFFALGWR